MVIFHGELLNNQMVDLDMDIYNILITIIYSLFCHTGLIYPIPKLSQTSGFFASMIVAFFFEAQVHLQVSRIAILPSKDEKATWFPVKHLFNDSTKL